MTGRQVRLSCADCEAAAAEVPDAVDIGSVKTTRLSTKGRSVTIAEFSPLKGPGRWVAVFAAKSKGKPAAVLLKGFVDRPRKARGRAKRTTRLLVEGGGANKTLVLGKQYAQGSLCGRPTLLAVRQFEGDGWVHKPPHGLNLAEMQRATLLTAAPAAASVAHPILRLVVASRAIGSTENNLLTAATAGAWEVVADAAAGSDFATFDVPPVSLTGVSIAAPLKAEQSPNQLFIVTDGATYQVKLAPAWSGKQRIDFPAPITTRCLALVVGSAAPRNPDPEATVPRWAIGAFEAHTALDGISLDDLSRRIGDPTARQILKRYGKRATEALVEAYPQLSPTDRREAGDLMSSLPCTESAGFYADRLLGVGAKPDFDPAIDPTARRARQQLRMCPNAGADALLGRANPTGAVQHSSLQHSSLQHSSLQHSSLQHSSLQLWALQEAAKLAPTRSAQLIVKMLSAKQVSPGVAPAKSLRFERRALTQALSTSFKQRRDAEHVMSALVNDLKTASPGLKLDVIRALGPHLSQLPQGVTMFDTIKGNPEFRVRYLLLTPARELALAGKASGVAHLLASISKGRHALRTEALRQAAGLPELKPAVLKSLAADHPRIRHAALTALAEYPRGAAGGRTLDQGLIKLARFEPWGFVRVQAVYALGQQPISPETTDTLGDLLDDEQPLRIQQAALSSIGTRRDTTLAPRVRSLAGDARQSVKLRTAAIRALGELCDSEAEELLVKLALRTAIKQLPYDEPLGQAALKALARLSPADLKRQLAPLLRPDRHVDPNVRDLARAATAGPPQCR